MASYARGPLIAGIVAVVLCGAACERAGAPAGRVLRDVQVASVHHALLSVDAGASLHLRVRVREGAVRPVLHLWDPRAAREVARAGTGFVLGDVELEHGAQPEQHSYVLLVRARHGGTGRVDLLRDGRPLASDVKLAGVPRAVPGAQGDRYMAARTPGGARSAGLYAFDREGRLLGLDHEGGPVGMPALEYVAGMHALLTASRQGSSGALSVYVNDADDRDGDGLGRALERALGSCDDVDDPGCGDGPLGDYYREVEHATRDSDRDGLDDLPELFGLAARPGTGGAGLDLPGFGADPRHKDVFVEVDYQRGLGGHGLGARDLGELAALFAAGPAADLRNPDGRDGVALHLDVGAEPQDPAQLGLFGDWGGSGEAPGRKYRELRKRHMAQQRRGVFRYALAIGSGTGQSGGGALAFNTHRDRVRIFAHELGHLLGLEHHGTDAWGGGNCKLPYRSIMNYVYQYDRAVGFSTAGEATLNPAAVIEASALAQAGGRDPLELLAPPVELEAFDGGIDYNRDGLISQQPVRAGLTWATYKSCDAAGHGRRTLWEEDGQGQEREQGQQREQGEAAASSPVLLRSGARMQALFVGADGGAGGAVWWASGPASAPEGAWGAARVIAGLPAAQAIAAAQLDDTHLALALVHGQGELSIATLELGGDAVTPLAIEIAPVTGARARGEPVLLAQTSGAQDTLALQLLFRAAADSRLMQAQGSATGAPLVVRVALDDREQPITLGRSPSAAMLGTGELCGVFPDAEAFMRFHCFDGGSGRWIDLTARAFYAGLGPETRGKVSIAYHRYRASDGTPTSGDDSRGAVYLGFTEHNSVNEPDNPHLLISRWLSSRPGAGARSQIDFRWRGRLLTEWTNLPSHAGFALHEDPELPRLQALLPERAARGGPTKLTFLPFADGTHEATLGTGNDFQVMERNICRRLHNTKRCGTKKTAAY